MVALTLLLRNVLRRSPKSSVLALLPRGAAKTSAFALLCVLIAIVEEYIYRGFALATLLDWLHSGAVSAGLVGLSFALMHGLQDWIAIVAAFVQGVLLTVPILVIHSLVPSSHHSPGRFGSEAPPRLQALALGRRVLRKHRVAMAARYCGVTALLSGAYRLRGRAVEAAPRVCKISAAPHTSGSQSSRPSVRGDHH